MRKPSVKFRREIKRAVGEDDFLGGIQRDTELADEVRHMMDSKGGAMLFASFEEIERGCYAEMANTSPLRVFKQIQIRAELTTVQFIKSKLTNYITNADALVQNINDINGENVDEY